jgi:hypothetical protein
MCFEAHAVIAVSILPAPKSRNVLRIFAFLTSWPPIRRDGKNVVDQKYSRPGDINNGHSSISFAERLTLSAGLAVCDLAVGRSIAAWRVLETSDARQIGFKMQAATARRRFQEI